MEAPKPAASDESAEVIRTVQAWAKAWASRDVKAYLGFYSENFKTPKGEARSAWEADRRRIIGAFRKPGQAQ